MKRLCSYYCLRSINTTNNISYVYFDGDISDANTANIFSINTVCKI